jgi:hypothetical protein
MRVEPPAASNTMATAEDGRADEGNDEGKSEDMADGAHGRRGRWRYIAPATRFGASC